MNRLNEIWQRDLDDAIRRAKSDGRSSVADYLSLRSSNDSIRRKSIKWLFDTVLDIVFAFNRHGARIKIEQKDGHRFDYAGAVLTGSRLKLQQGIRCLTLEAGWTQGPGDGFMRGGALAFARITHFGFAKENADLALHSLDRVPQWFVIADEQRRISFSIADLRRHFEVFLG